MAGLSQAGWSRSVASLDDENGGSGVPFSQAMHQSLADPLGMAASRNGFEADMAWDAGGGARRHGKVREGERKREDALGLLNGAAARVANSTPLGSRPASCTHWLGLRRQRGAWSEAEQNTFPPPKLHRFSTTPSTATSTCPPWKSPSSTPPTFRGCAT